MKLSFKWLTVPFSNATKDVEAVQLWEVRWRATHPHMTALSNDFREHIEAFTSEEEADAFAEALSNAFKLTRTGKFTNVSVMKG